jgi:uncharacterized caspase-like protein
VLDDFRASVTSVDEAIVFYAGHGMNIGGRDILAPTDMPDVCSAGPLRRLVELDHIFKAIKSARSKIVILDACRNNPFPRCPTRGQEGTGFRGLARIQDQGLLIANATQGEGLADDGIAGAGSPFVNALVARLKQHPRMEFVLLLRKVAQDVEQATGGRQRTELRLVGAGPETCLAGSGCGL